MLAELPFTSAEEIAAEYKPGSGVTTKSALATLVKKGLVSAGIDARIRAEGGRLGGSLHLYSALNLDAVRLHRRGDDKAAIALAKRAGKLERAAVKANLSRYISSNWPESGNLSTAISVTLKGEASDALRDIAASTVEIRRATALEQPVFGSIERLDESFVVVVIDGLDEVMSLPADDLAPTIDRREGAVLSMRWQRLAPGMTLLTTAPAIDLGGDANPFELPLPADAARIDITGVVAGGPTMRRPARIKISG